MIISHGEEGGGCVILQNGGYSWPQKPQFVILSEVSPFACEWATQSKDP